MTEEIENPSGQAVVTGPRPTERLAARRVELGLSLEDVAHQLKFAPRQIEALEAAEFERLPGGTFARGMVRSYARLLKIEPEPALAQLAQTGLVAQPKPEDAVSMRTPIPFSERGRHVNLVYTAMSVGILTAVVFFALEWYHEKSGPQKLAFVAPAQDGPSAAIPVPLAPAMGPAQERPAQVASAAPSRIAETTPPVDEVGQDPKQVPVAAGNGRLVLRFDRDSWVEVKGRNGMLLSQLNPAGSEKVIDGEPPFHLTIGNAPNVRLTYNDQPVDLKPHFKVDVARLTLN